MSLITTSKEKVIKRVIKAHFGSIDPAPERNCATRRGYLHKEADALLNPESAREQENLKHFGSGRGGHCGYEYHKYMYRFKF
jgi:hypothetical protein